MIVSLEKLKQWMEDNENEHLEFKEARSKFDFEELVKYCVAIANEGGGIIVLGVTNDHPRRVVGSDAFDNLERTKAGLIERLHLRIHVEALQHPDGRVLIFEVPSRPIGMPVHYRGAYWMRGGEALLPMTPDQIKRILDEAGLDFSAEICPNATISDLDPSAIERLRMMWRRKSGNEAINRLSAEQILRDTELLVDHGVTYAALILLGTQRALSKYLPQAEVIFEYRSSDASIPYQQRKEYRRAFFLFDEDLWGTINLRNDIQHYQEGLFVWDIPTFNEIVVREAVLNAISHRDYRLAGSVFVKQFPRKLEIVSPGGFPPGITSENILWRQLPRNRRIAEVLSKCGLVERSGQGADRMFEVSIKESKPRPDFAGTDAFQVSIALYGEVQDLRFLKFLEQVGQETLATFTTKDLLILDYVHRDKFIPEELKDRLAFLRDRGVIEVSGRGRGTRYILSRQLYAFIGKKGAYTRKRGLDRETNKALLLKHLDDYKGDGSRLQDLAQVLPHLTHNQVQKLLAELKKQGKIRCNGKTNAARWFPAG